MIIYRESIGKFISQCFDGSAVRNIGSVISEQMRLNGISYFGDSQVNAWNASLPEMAKELQESNIDRDIDVAVEYKLVQSRDRIDFLICGNDDSGHENVVVVELKQWCQARPTKKQFLVNKGVEEAFPSKIRKRQRNAWTRSSRTPVRLL